MKAKKSADMIDLAEWWLVVFGKRDEAELVLEYCLVPDRGVVAAWVDEMAAGAWDAGGLDGPMPERWEEHAEAAADSLMERMLSPEEGA